MTQHRSRRLMIGLVLLCIAVASVAGYRWWTGQTDDPNRLAATGTLEGRRVLVAAELSGRVTQVLVDRGALVEAGQPLVRLDDTDLRLKLLQAPAGGPEQQQLQQQLAKLTLKAPLGGIVTERAIEPGELAMTGAPLLTIDHLDEVELTLFISERQIGRVQVGQSVALTTNSWPDRTFAGQVQSINPRAEFTPRNIQSPKDRALLVFGVHVAVPNPAGHLKPGMPVDAVIQESQ
jgi:HlyD family secretion protein